MGNFFFLPLLLASVQNGMSQPVCLCTGSGYIDTFIPDGRTILCFDGFHPGELGYAAWGRFLADELMALLETQQEHMVQDQSVGPCPAVDHDQEQPGTC